MASFSTNCVGIILTLLIFLAFYIELGECLCDDKADTAWCKQRANQCFSAKEQKTMLDKCQSTCKLCNAPKCRTGFMVSKTLECVDIDECSDKDLNNCAPTAVCKNLSGSFVCKCPTDKPYGDPTKQCEVSCKNQIPKEKCEDRAAWGWCFDPVLQPKMLEKCPFTCGFCKPPTCKSGQFICRDLKCTNNVTCSVGGDPNIQTFDQMTLPFDGVCSYTLVSTFCSTQTDSLPMGLKNFKLTIKNKYKGAQACRASIDYMDIQAQSQRIQIYGNGKVFVNDEKMELPYLPEDAPCIVKIEEDSVYLQCKFGLGLLLMSPDQAVVNIDPAYRGYVCGLCGNADKSKKNDMTMKDGHISDIHAQVADSWKQAGKCW